MLARLLAAGALCVVAVRFMNKWGPVNNWGATREEIAAALPGDEFVEDPADTTTRAVTIEAPATEVWRWLVQIGQDRGGMYSYDAIENLMGLDIHSTDEIREEWHDLAVGDHVVLVPTGWPALPSGYALRVARLDPGSPIVLRQSPPEHPWNAVWSFVVGSTAEYRCRLITRTRAARPASIELRAAGAVFEPVALVMTRRMLLGIKQRAERSFASAKQPERCTS